MDTLLDARPAPTRLQMESANRMGQRLALADAHQKASELFSAMDDMLRALKAMEACGAAKAFLWDTAAGTRDQTSKAMAAINRNLDEQGAYPLDPLDLSDLDAFLAKVA